MSANSIMIAMMLDKKFDYTTWRRGFDVDLIQAKQMAKDTNCVIIYGMSDDELAFEGAFDNEVGAYEGTEAYIDLIDGDLLELPDGQECLECRYLTKRIEEHCISVTAKWVDGAGDLCWEIDSECPNNTFIITEDDVPYCRGIVIDLNDAKAYKAQEREA